MASLSPSSRRAASGRAGYPARFVLRGGRWNRAWVALTLTLMLRLIPANAFQALDMVATAPRQNETAITPNPSEDAARIFPGSAYFFAENAFAPANSAIGVSHGYSASPHVLQIEHGPAALSLALHGETRLDDVRALQCMTNAIYFEAGNEPEEGQRGVAQVILNRVMSSRWPGSVCAVVYEGGERSDRKCQFTFSCDGSMARIPSPAAWSRARRVATRALAGEVFAPAGLATFYHTLAVQAPWSDKVRPVAVIGAHIFYRLPGDAGSPAAYRAHYSGREFAQPGPFAFVPPLRPLPIPPGPDMWGAIAPALPYASPPGLALPVSSGSFPQENGAIRAPIGTTPDATPASRDALLPPSTIRPEFRNTGRLLG